MGMMKHKLEDKNALYGLAVDILQRVGAIKTCEVHGDRCLVDESKLQDACKFVSFPSFGVFRPNLSRKFTL